MIRQLLYILAVFMVMPLQAQETPVVSFNLPVRNSMKFNRHLLNPTFNYVREANRHISFTNKRQWVQFNDAPTSYFGTYGGRLNENMGIGVSVFQQTFGVFTNFGGVLNYAYNVPINRDSNLTFGANLGVYSNGINESNVVVNTPDPALNDLPSNVLMTLNPGINYGTEFWDFGLALNNFALYNLNTSELVKDDSEKGIQAHIMYTGYIQSFGFLDDAKFSGLVRSEFNNENTVVSGLLHMMSPKGIWGQVGYNSLYGASAGLGIHLTKSIGLEYNYERAMGTFGDFGPSHEITLAYRFENNKRFDYSDEDEVASIFPQKRKVKVNKTDEATRARIAQRAEARKADREITEVAKAEPAVDEVAEQAKREEEAIAKQEAEAKAKAERDARLEAERIERERLAEQARIRAEELAKAKAEEEAKLAEQRRLQAERAEKARLEAERLKKEQQAEEARIAEENRIKTQKEEEERIATERLAQIELEAKRKAEEQAKAEAEAKAQAEEEARIETERLAQIELEAKRKAEEKAKEEEAISKETLDAKTLQDDLLEQLKETVASRAQDLADLKEENDLSEKGIYKAPKPFKSISAENAKLESLKNQLDAVIAEQDDKLTTLQKSYDDRVKATSEEDSIATIYLKEILLIQSSKSKAEREKAQLVSELALIKEATDFERKRRIKRAAFDNDSERYAKDRSTLNQIKASTDIGSGIVAEEDLDFGDIEANKVTILKNIQNVDEGVYMVLAVHKDVEKRDKFLKDAMKSGLGNIDFFFDINTSKYYIYHKKHENLEMANRALNSKEDKPYNAKMSMIKIEK
ncbi:PorP/SprF family type IX secretion system membrane protein [Winogradskyella maritima]|uniref:PorP/SprF family type IX secretion system membrane protein n=1 Tax=Winogradskyella maritima TaxID=1517766 RepID=A0ABV8AMY2_9FLAO|nr:PorP/SprF family type IX secretion system membrane protein [Winogradskyella maritima]